MNFRVVFSLILIFILSAFIVSKITGLAQKKELTSPVLGISKEDISLNTWSPDMVKDKAFSDAPDITATSALFVDTATGEVLYAKNPEARLPIASLTKIMTAIVVLEKKTFDEIFTVSQRASEMEPDEMVLLPGEKHTLKNLLDGIFLVSANDAAEAIAEGATGRREEFINLMNSKAVQLGMNNTLFINPTGLEEDNRSQYSTGLDVAIMSRFLIRKWPEIVDISSQPYVYLEKTADHQDYEMYSGINLLTTYPGVVGLKTGYTPEAGLTLVTLARQNGKEVLGVLLGAVNRRDDAKAMLDYAFEER
ncbi:MAG TPA: D-alanyl-D-alanine carboxypeptidase family protein [Patescibacteria group bacterium]|nr:D-alanyl-D-alanine carboxypeptidase family protein [Patescibacteria group bacterium]